MSFGMNKSTESPYEQIPKIMDFFFIIRIFFLPTKFQIYFLYSLEYVQRLQMLIFDIQIIWWLEN